MSEVVYVIRLKKDKEQQHKGDEVNYGFDPPYDYQISRYGHSSTCHQNIILPSEQRYSANLVCGLGVIHVVLGVLSALFSVCALFSGECYEVNMPASGLWCGFIYVGAGILGLLASKKWYVRRQIFIFLLASTISLVSSASCIVITSVSIHNSKRRNSGPCIITGNIYISSFLELLWSILSVYFAFNGTVSREYSFSSPKTAPKLPQLGTKKATLEIRKKGKKSLRNLEKREYILEDNLPLEYNIGGNEALSAPDLLCHLSNPKTQQYHVTRSNPLCHTKYFSESDVDEVSNSIRGIENEYLEETLERHDISDYFVHISEPTKLAANGYIVPSRNSTTAEESYEFEFHQENNNIEETEYDIEQSNYNKINLIQDITNDRNKEEMSFEAMSAVDVKVVPEQCNKINKATLNTKPTLPLSPWNQSITLEDKVQRFLAQAAELAHQNTTKITSEYR